MTRTSERLEAFAELLEAEWYNGNLSGSAYERLNADLTAIVEWEKEAGPAPEGAATDIAGLGPDRATLADPPA